VKRERQIMSYTTLSWSAIREGVRGFWLQLAAMTRGREVESLPARGDLR
jgi:hypothetical protein